MSDTNLELLVLKPSALIRRLFYFRSGECVLEISRLVAYFGIFSCLN